MSNLGMEAQLTSFCRNIIKMQEEYEKGREQSLRTLLCILEDKFRKLIIAGELHKRIVISDEPETHLVSMFIENLKGYDFCVQPKPDGGYWISINIDEFYNRFSSEE